MDQSAAYSFDQDGVVYFEFDDRIERGSVLLCVEISHKMANNIHLFEHKVELISLTNCSREAVENEATLACGLRKIVLDHLADNLVGN